MRKIFIFFFISVSFKVTRYQREFRIKRSRRELLIIKRSRRELFYLKRKADVPVVAGQSLLTQVDEEKLPFLVISKPGNLKPEFQSQNLAA
jgi:hypothetical protein